MALNPNAMTEIPDARGVKLKCRKGINTFPALSFKTLLSRSEKAF
jgi:hypothetical protein